MTDPLAFLSAVLTLLALPGPTNTLLATAGAAVGLRRSLVLIPAEMLGYAASVSTLALAAGPLVREWPGVGIGLRLACGVYLARLAVRMWRDHGWSAGVAQRPVSFGQVLLTTLLNPKGLVFAFGIMPHLTEGPKAEALPYALALLVAIMMVGAGWIGLGATIRVGLGERLRLDLACRIGAAAILVFALAISGSALGFAGFSTR